MLRRFLFSFFVAMIFSGSVVFGMLENPWDKLDAWDDIHQWLDDRINFCDTNDGMTPLMRIIFKTQKGFDNKKVLEAALFNKWIDVNAQDKQGTTALMFAAIRGEKGLVKKLLTHHEIDVDLQDIFGNTALILAVKAQSLKIVKMLLDKQCNCSLLTKTGKTALSFAIQNEDEKMAGLLFPHTAIKNGRSLVHSLSNLKSLKRGSLPNLFNNNNNIDSDENDGLDE